MQEIGVLLDKRFRIIKMAEIGLAALLPKCPEPLSDHLIIYINGRTEPDPDNTGGGKL